jgi:hypothetical protein
LRLSHVPIGRIQEAFDFGRPSGGPRKADRRITSAANLVDTLVAKRCLEEQLESQPETLPDRVISFVEMDATMRLLYQAGAWTAPVYGQRWARRLLGFPLSFLPDGPPAEERRAHRRLLVLHIDDRVGERLIRWRLETPDVYDVTARCALEVAQSVPEQGRFGWQTPGSFIEPFPPFQKGSVEFSNLALTGCTLTVTSP